MKLNNRWCTSHDIGPHLCWVPNWSPYTEAAGNWRKRQTTSNRQVGILVSKRIIVHTRLVLSVKTQLPFNLQVNPTSAPPHKDYKQSRMTWLHLNYSPTSFLILLLFSLHLSLLSPCLSVSLFLSLFLLPLLKGIFPKWL